MARKAKKRNTSHELKLNEDPFLFDDPGGSALEWLFLSAPCLREAVRRGEQDPWERVLQGDELTEHRRRKLELLSLVIDEERNDSVA